MEKEEKNKTNKHLHLPQFDSSPREEAIREGEFRTIIEWSWSQSTRSSQPLCSTSSPVFSAHVLPISLLTLEQQSEEERELLPSHAVW